jgi:hypothetical protein
VLGSVIQNLEPGSVLQSEQLEFQIPELIHHPYQRYTYFLIPDHRDIQDTPTKLLTNLIKIYNHNKSK